MADEATYGVTPDSVAIVLGGVAFSARTTPTLAMVTAEIARWVNVIDGIVYSAGLDPDALRASPTSATYAAAYTHAGLYVEAKATARIVLGRASNDQANNKASALRKEAQAAESAFRGDIAKLGRARPSGDGALGTYESDAGATLTTAERGRQTFTDRYLGADKL